MNATICHFILAPTLVGYSLMLMYCSKGVGATDIPAAAQPVQISHETKPHPQNTEVISPSPIPKEDRPIHTDLPHVPTPLWVEGFRHASHVGPENPSPKGSPVVIVLHGNYDRPEWECEMWNEVAGFYGWILCPRGIPTPWADISEDRWMYQSKAKTAQEIDAALRSLKATYPGQVRDEGTVLVGFSLGAMYAPSLAIESPGKYSWLYLIEGGASKLDKERIKSLKRAGIRGIGMAMSTGSNRTAAKDALKHIEKLGLKHVYVNMAGAGHGYRFDFGITGRQSLMELLSTESFPPGSEAIVEH